MRSRVIRRRLLVAAGLLLAAAPLTAQEPRTGRIDGRVTDSVHARPLGGATVMALRLLTDSVGVASSVTDDAGRFRFDSLAPGRYAVSFTHSFLDSLDLVLPDHEVVLAAGERRSVELGLPSAATLRAAACPGVRLAPGQGGVVGTVTNATTDRPVAGVTVVVAWNELTVNRATASAVTENRTGAVRTDSLGQYRLCGVPTDSPLAIQVQQDSATGGVVEVMVDDSVGMLLRNISYAPETAPPVATGAAAATDTVRLPPSAGTATLTGTVTGAGGLPLRDVQLRVVNARGAARSDSLGRFTLSELPAGTRMLEARRIGYVLASVPVELRAGRLTMQPVRLTHVVSLDSILIVAQRTRYREFERHRKSTFGRFLDETEIMRRNPYETSDLLRMMPGFRVVRSGFDEKIISSRGQVSLRGGPCETNIVIDGMQHMDITMVHPADIGALEAYAGRAGAPPEYDSVCGVVLIWTKR